MNQILLIDADGVAIKQHKYFSDIYSEANNVPIEKIRPFFQNRFSACQKGHADLKEEIVPYLKDWNWNKSADELLKYWFESDAVADQAVLNLIQDLRNKGIKVYLATDQEKYRAEYINKVLGFKNYFDGTFYSFEVGSQKSEKEYFQVVLNSLGKRPEEVSYLDDEIENVEVAKELGIDAKLYTNLDDLKYR